MSRRVTESSSAQAVRRVETIAKIRRAEFYEAVNLCMDGNPGTRGARPSESASLRGTEFVRPCPGRPDPMSITAIASRKSFVQAGEQDRDDDRGRSSH